MGICARACAGSAVVTLLMMSGGCGYNRSAQEEGVTTVRIEPAKQIGLKRAATQLTGPLNGGVFIYASRSDGSFSTNFRLPSEFTGGSFVLPNGNYRFFAFGFQSLGLGGMVHCSDVPVVDLFGGSITINLTLDSTTCGVLPFAEPVFAAGGSPKPMGIRLCPPGASAGQFDSVTSPSDTCSGPAFAIASVAILFPIFVSNSPSQYADIGPAPSSDNAVCIQVSGTDTLTDIQLPYGDSTAAAMLLLPTRLGLFTSGDCSGPPVWKFDFPRGLANQSAAGKFDATGAAAGFGLQVVKVFPGSGTARLFLSN